MEQGTKKQLTTKLLIAGGAVLLAVALLLVYIFAIPKPVKGEKAFELTITADGSSKVIDASTDAEYLVDLLDELDKKLHLSYEAVDGAYGPMITTINKRVADESKNEYWAIYIDGEYGMFGIKEQVMIKAGTDNPDYVMKIELKLESF